MKKTNRIELSDKLAIVDYFRPDGSLQRSSLLWKYSDGWHEIYQTRRNRSMIDDLRDGSVYDELNSTSAPYLTLYGRGFGDLIRSVVEESGIL